MKTCPFCAEEIQDAAIVCKHCGRELPTAAEAFQSATDIAKTESAPIEPEPIPDVTVTSLAVSASETTVEVEATKVVTATASYSDGTSAEITPTWSSENTFIASVSDSGTVTGVAEGTTTITGTFGGQSGSVDIKVDKPLGMGAGLLLALGGFGLVFVNVGGVLNWILNLVGFFVLFFGLVPLLPKSWQDNRPPVSLILALVLCIPIPVYWSLGEREEPRAEQEAEQAAEQEAEQAVEQAAIQRQRTEGAGLPGLTSGDLRVNLERRGLSCSGPRTQGTTPSWLCESQGPGGALYRVEFIGRPTRIEYVTATAITGGGGNQVAADFLGFIATTPYDGASPERARAWVEANVGGFAETEIGPAMLRLSGPDNAPSLSLAAPSSRWMQ